MPQSVNVLLNALPFFVLVGSSLWLIWFLLTCLNRITRSLQEIAVTLRRMEQRATDAECSRHA